MNTRKKLVVSGWIISLFPLVISWGSAAVAYGIGCWVGIATLEVAGGYHGTCSLFGLQIGKALFVMGNMFYLIFLSIPIGVAVAGIGVFFFPKNK